MGRISVAMIVAAGDGFGWTALAGVVLIVFGVALLVLVDAPRRVLNTVGQRVRGRGVRREHVPAAPDGAQPPVPVVATSDRGPAPVSSAVIAHAERRAVSVPVPEEHAPERHEMHVAVSERDAPGGERYAPGGEWYAPAAAQSPIEPAPAVVPEPPVTPEGSPSDLWVTVPEGPPVS